MHLQSSILLAVSLLPLAESLQCYGFSKYDYEGRVQDTGKSQIMCPGSYCMTISEESSDFTVYNGTCPDPSASITNCENNGVGCQKEKISGVYVKVCCCNTELCNSSTVTSLHVYSFFILLILYYLEMK
ncbi:hypothetical protein L5515_016185 [Caenorhabditis briggsae]|uniref:UPAR/Ly6 domain-containing protein n=1 Tax=Caenorhabditis briggsae TaxID=6238 RepID=A0AAE9FDK4_CAEBR|nr:hypothetical protein L5515_016185 [Caenorhabditis briggsae]